MPIIRSCRQTQAWLARLTLLTFVATLSACNPEGDPGFVVEDDSIAPSAVFDLRVSSRDDSTLTLLWTSPGDDGTEGRAWRYDVRRSSEPIDEDSWPNATTIRGEPAPSPAGRTELFLLLGLGATERYFFSLRTEDEWGNLSALSNVAEAEPLDRIAPGRVSDLRGEAVGPLEVELTWTATGDDGDTGRASGYVLRYAEFELSAENFGTGTIVSPAPIPQVSGERETFRVTLDAGGTRTVWFALQVWDEVGQAGALSNVASVEIEGAAGVRRLGIGRVK